ncbi:MAG: hypothetical protein AAGB19_01595 [Cyanobacteria bacterium P01_F01_bin.3]
MNFFDVATIVVGVSSLAVLAAKSLCLVWAFVRLRNLSALVYLAFLWVSALLPVVMAYTLSPADYGSVALFVGLGSNVVEAGLFIWLVSSFVKRANATAHDSEDVSQDA